MSKTKEAPAAVDQRAESVTMIPIGEVHAATDNPRRQLGDLTELTESIKANGIIEPLVVVPRDHDGYSVVVGHRRRGAGELAELKWLPCIVRTYDDQRRRIVMLVENLQREDLGALEEAAGYQQLVDGGLSQRQIAEQVGRSQAHVSKHLGLLQLPEKAREAVDSHRISKEDAFELAKLVEHPEAIERAVERPGRSGYADVGSHARALVDQLTSDEARKTTRERLLAEGKQVVGEASGSYMAGPYYPGALLSDLGRRHAKFDAKAHEKLKCHGFWIGWDGEAHAACSDAQKHQPASRQPKQDPEVERRFKEQERKRDALDKLRDRRLKYIQLLLDGKLGADARDHVVRMAIHIYEPEWDMAEEWLGLERDGDRYDDSPDTLITRWVAEAPTTRQLQAALAMVLEQGERTLRYYHPQPEDGDRACVRAHFEFLSFNGLDLAPDELALMEPPVRRECANPKCARALDEDDEGTYCDRHAWMAQIPEGANVDAVNWLVNCPDGDTNWKSAFDRAGLGELIAAKAGILKSTRPRKSALAKIEARIRKLEKSPAAEAPSASGSPELDVSKLLGSVTRHLVSVRKERQLLEQAIEKDGRGATTPRRKVKLDAQQSELRKLRESEASLETEVADLQRIVRERAPAPEFGAASPLQPGDGSEGYSDAADLPVGNFDEDEEPPEKQPCPVCRSLACAHTVEEKARAAAAALAGVAVATVKPRDPRACRECGCHGDCDPPCSWVDVDDVKGLLCSSHELVPA